jgi:hypothetical protein
MKQADTDATVTTDGPAGTDVASDEAPGSTPGSQQNGQ